MGKIRESFPEEMTPKLSFNGLITMKQVDKIVGKEYLPGRIALERHDSPKAAASS